MLAEKSARNVLVYNRIPKSGSTMMLGLLYSLAKSLGYLVLRGRYHSYRYWTNNDRVGQLHGEQTAPASVYQPDEGPGGPSHIQLRLQADRGT